jgi:hypothetical protein
MNSLGGGVKAARSFKTNTASQSAAADESAGGGKAEDQRRAGEECCSLVCGEESVYQR